MSTHTLNIRLLTGEIIQLIRPADQEFDLIQLLDELYPHVPEIPYGSLALRRVLPDFEELDLHDDDALFRRMGETLLDKPSDPYEVTGLYDGIELVAVSDLSLLSVSISPNGSIVFADPENNSAYSVLCYQLNVHTRDPLFAHFHHDILLTVPFITDYQCTQFGLYQHVTKSRKHHQCYTPTSHFQWFPSLSKCLLHASESIPRDQDSLLRSEHVLRFEQWYNPALPWIQGPHGWHQDLPEVQDQLDDDQDDPRDDYDYADDYDDERQQFYEDHIRWD